MGANAPIAVDKLLSKPVSFTWTTMELDLLKLATRTGESESMGAWYFKIPFEIIANRWYIDIISTVARIESMLIRNRWRFQKVNLLIKITKKLINYEVINFFDCSLILYT